MIVLCLVSWLVVSVAAGVFVGRAIHRAHAMELRRLPYAGTARERPRSESPARSAPVPASPSGVDVRWHARAA